MFIMVAMCKAVIQVKESWRTSLVITHSKVLTWIMGWKALRFPTSTEHFDHKGTLLPKRWCGRWISDMNLFSFIAFMSPACFVEDPEWWCQLPSTGIPPQKRGDSSHHTMACVDALIHEYRLKDRENEQNAHWHSGILTVESNSLPKWKQHRMVMSSGWYLMYVIYDFEGKHSIPWNRSALERG